MSKNRPSGICKPTTPSKPLGNMMPVFGPVVGPTEFNVRRRLAKVRPPPENPDDPDEHKAVWKPVRSIFEAFAEAEIARARLADTSPDSPPDIIAERDAAYTVAVARLEQVREDSGMFGDDKKNRDINITISDLEYTYRNPIPPRQPTPIPSKSNPGGLARPHCGYRFGGRRTRHRKEGKGGSRKRTKKYTRKQRRSRRKTFRRKLT